MTPNLTAQAIDPMTRLQNRWYNGLTSGLPLSPETFQIRLPASPLDPSDLALWAAQDALPPASLTFRTAAQGTPTFFAEYAAVATEMEFPQSTFAQDIGEENYQAWTAYLATLTPPPTSAELPAVFQSWAALYAPSVVAVGVADLTAMALISESQQALAPYLGPHGRPADFTGTYDDLCETLGASSGAGLAFDSATTPGDVKNTWTGGVDTGTGGLWTGADATSRLSRRFAAGGVTVRASFQHFALWTSTPGAWYDSSLLHTAYSTPGTPPWPEPADPTWAEVFGPEGTLRYLTAALVVVDGLQATITSDAFYGAPSRQAIRGNAARGLWPFYAPNGPAVSNQVSFGKTSGLTITTTVQPGHPVVLGANVLAAGRYLGG